MWKDPKGVRTMREYRGYEITVNETMGIGEGPYFEIWKDGTLWGFCKKEEALDSLIDLIEKDRKAE